MKIVIFLSEIAILFFLGVVIIVGLKEKKNIFELFIQGCYDGVKVVLDITNDVFFIYNGIHR